MNSYLDVEKESHFWDNGYLAEIKHAHLPELGSIKVPGKAIVFHGTPTDAPTHGELLGQSTRPVLSQLGFSEDEITELANAGAIQNGVGSHFSSASYPAPEKPKSRL